MAITSLAFILVDVPEPVWKISIGNSPSCLPAATSAPDAWIAAAMSADISPRSQFAAAAADLTNPKARMNVRGKGIPLMGKFSIARCVWAL